MATAGVQAAMGGPVAGGPPVPQGTFEMPVNAFNPGMPGGMPGQMPMMAGYPPAMMPGRGNTPAFLPTGYMAPAPGWGMPATQAPRQTMFPGQATAPPAVGALQHAPAPALLAMLKDSLYPSQREWAADCLSQQEWRSQPQVVQALVAAAKDDPAPAVRAGCVRALGRMGANTPEAVTAVAALRSDGDPRVRQEAELALPALGVAARAHAESGLRPAAATFPAGNR
jgi:hypothetical protein